MENAQNPPRFQVCVLTSTRADYGILRPLISTLSTDESLELRLAVTGTHLSAAFGITVQEIEQDGFPIDVKIPILQGDGDASADISRAMAAATAGFGTYFQQSRPDLLVVMGDRYETFAVCAAAVNSCIPIAHLSGGETTEGAMDECFRHCITKMSYLHFTAAEVYRKRVIQLGENPARVFCVGEMGVENALHEQLFSPEQLEASLGFRLLDKPYVVTTFHPVTLEPNSAVRQVEEMLAAIADRSDMNFLITKSNADIEGQRINERLEDFARETHHCYVTASLGMRRYLSALKYACCVLGNSSSGLVEAPSFGIPTINIGDRQRGRLQAESVINCQPEKKDILRALDRACSLEFRERASKAVNPYGDGNTSGKICRIIKDTLLSGEIDLKKRFYDISIPETT